MKSLISIGLLLILLIPGGLLYAHPIKMTTGKLQIDTKDKNCILTLNFFIDDFESTLRKIYPQPAFNYDEPGETMKATIYEYITSNFELKLDDTVISFNLESIKKIEDNVCQVTLNGNFTNLSDFNLITVKDVLLFSSFSKQSNILHVFIDNGSHKILQFYPGVPVRIEKL
ncbi:DUF6702 family protein [Saccharicrinis sp. FJH2]|uniref:DUF6702 family protein n=1 Tax=Saccharicrinis sp. FJH65 TaxID=3344659 RepID=UPI0035F4329A